MHALMLSLTLGHIRSICFHFLFIFLDTTYVVIFFIYFSLNVHLDITLFHIFIFLLLIFDVTFIPLQILSQILFTRGRGRGGMVGFGLVCCLCFKYDRYRCNGTLNRSHICCFTCRLPGRATG
jgi:hypothetical protein